MAKVLYIKANPKKEEDSYSLAVGRHFINSYKEKNNEDEIIEINVYEYSIPLLDEDVLNAWQKFKNNVNFNDLSENEKFKIVNMNKILDEFISADKYVISSPMWNFSIPPMLKAYIDNIVIAGKTFQFTSLGPVGLLKNKKMLHIQASGGVYYNSPYDFSNKYLNTIFNFIGIESVEPIFIAGVNMYPDKADEIKKDALNKAQKAALTF